MAEGRLRVKIRGRVQGVWFRASTRDEAVRLGLSGWVRNLPDGRVEAVFEGPEEGLEKMLAWCRQGPSLAEVIEVETEPGVATGQFSGFKIAY